MEDARAKLIAKAVKDPAFRAALFKDANTAVETALGVKLPPGTRIKVVEDSATEVHLILPPARVDGALSDAELETVAGGFAQTRMCDGAIPGGSTCAS